MVSVVGGCGGGQAGGCGLSPPPLLCAVPPTVSVPSDHVQVYLDSSVSVMCEGEGVPPPHVYWSTVRGGVVNSSTLEFTIAKLSDAGEYSCFGVSVAGASRTAMIVVVRGEGEGRGSGWGGEREIMREKREGGVKRGIKRVCGVRS